MSAQKFRGTKNKVFLELRESSTDFFGLFLTIARQRPALARIVTTFCMAEHKDHAFIVLDAFVDILNIDKFLSIGGKDKIAVLFNSGCFAPFFLFAIVHKELARECATTHFAIFSRSCIVYEIFHFVWNRNPAFFFITDKAFRRLRYIAVICRIELARLVTDKENIIDRLVIASREFQFIQIKVLKVPFKFSSLAQSLFKSLAERGIAILEVVCQSPVSNGNPCIGVIPLAILADIGNNGLKELRKIAIGASLQQDRSSKQCSPRLTGIRYVNIFGNIEINRFQVEHVPHVFGGLVLCRFDRSFILSAQKFLCTFRFKRREQVQVENFPRGHIA